MPGMEQGISWKVEGQQALMVKLEKLQGIARKAMVPVIAKWALRLQAAARRAVAVDQGITRASILTEYFNKGLTAAVGSQMKAAIWLEFGTKPHWAPKGALAGWVKRHGMPESAEYLVRRAIARRGTKAQPFLEPAWKQVAPAYVEDTKQELQAVLIAIAKS